MLRSFKALAAKTSGCIAGYNKFCYLIFAVCTKKLLEVNGKKWSMLSPRKAKVKHIFYIKLNCHNRLPFVYRSDDGLTLETSAFLPFTMANLRFQLSC